MHCPRDMLVLRSSGLVAGKGFILVGSSPFGSSRFWSWLASWLGMFWPGMLPSSFTTPSKIDSVCMPAIYHVVVSEFVFLILYYFAGSQIWKVNW